MAWLIEETHPHGYKGYASRVFDTRAEARYRLAEMAVEPTPTEPEFAITRRASDLLAYDKAPCGHDDCCGQVYRVVKF